MSALPGAVSLEASIGGKSEVFELHSVVVDVVEFWVQVAKRGVGDIVSSFFLLLCSLPLHLKTNVFFMIHFYRGRGLYDMHVCRILVLVLGVVWRGEMGEKWKGRRE